MNSPNIKIDDRSQFTPLSLCFVAIHRHFFYSLLKHQEAIFEQILLKKTETTTKEVNILYMQGVLSELFYL